MTYNGNGVRAHQERGSKARVRGTKCRSGPGAVFGHLSVVCLGGGGRERGGAEGLYLSCAFYTHLVYISHTFRMCESR